MVESIVPPRPLPVSIAWADLSATTRGFRPSHRPTRVNAVRVACQLPADPMNRREIFIMMVAVASIEKYVISKEQRS